MLEGQPMVTVAAAVNDFLAQRRIAVAGVSRQPQGHGGNVVYRRLRDRGYEVFAVNPNADQLEGDACYHDLASIPGGVDAVVIATAPTAAASVVEECRRLGIGRVWMHRSFGTGSVSDAAAEAGRQAGMTVISGGCPLMFDPTADFGHKCMRWALSLTGGSPKTS
jgi:predicted CoA-binding protein